MEKGKQFDEIKVSFWGDKNALEVDSDDSRTEIVNGPKLWAAESVFFFPQIPGHTCQATLKQAIQLRMTLDFRSSALYLPIARITLVYMLRISFIHALPTVLIFREKQKS